MARRPGQARRRDPHAGADDLYAPVDPSSAGSSPHTARQRCRARRRTNAQARGMTARDQNFFSRGVRLTYCVSLKVAAGMVFASDSRTNAGFDQISTFRKMMVYERPGDRVMVLLSSGNLSISQSVRELLQAQRFAVDGNEPSTIWQASSMFDAARIL